MARPVRPELISLVMIISAAKLKKELCSAGFPPHPTHGTRQEGGDGNRQFKPPTSVGACVLVPGKTVVCL